jgi:hypothetical protein
MKFIELGKHFLNFHYFLAIYNFNIKNKKQMKKTQCLLSKSAGFEPTTREIFDPTIATALNRSSTFNSFKSIRQNTKTKAQEKTPII